MLSHDDSNKYVTGDLWIEIRIPALFMFQKKQYRKIKMLKYYENLHIEDSIVVIFL